MSDELGRFTAEEFAAAVQHAGAAYTNAICSPPANDSFGTKTSTATVGDVGRPQSEAHDVQISESGLHIGHASRLVRGLTSSGRGGSPSPRPGERDTPPANDNAGDCLSKIRPLSALVGPGPDKLPVTIAVWTYGPDVPARFESRDGTVYLISPTTLARIKREAEADAADALGVHRSHVVATTSFLGVPVVDLDAEGGAAERCRRIMCASIEAAIDTLAPGALRFPVRRDGQ